LTFLDANGIVLLEKDNVLYDAMIQIGTRQMNKAQLAELFRKLAAN